MVPHRPTYTDAFTTENDRPIVMLPVIQPTSMPPTCRTVTPQATFDSTINTARIIR